MLTCVIIAWQSQGMAGTGFQETSRHRCSCIDGGVLVRQLTSLLLSGHEVLAREDASVARIASRFILRHVTPTYPSACRAGKPQRWARGNPRSAHSKGSAESRLTDEESKLVSKPTLALQGLSTPARAQLMALSLLALELQVSYLPGEFARCSPASRRAGLSNNQTRTPGSG